MSVTHKALKFGCEGQELIGILSLPADPDIPVTTGLITLPAGGPQYRVGMGRQLFQLANHLASQGIAVLRFDNRGIGDSEGQFEGFMSVEPDLRASIDVLKKHVPEIERLALWGGCNAASAIMTHGHKFQEVTDFIISNPFLGTNQLSAQARKMHFAERIKQKEFWAKLFSGKYNLWGYARALGRYLTGKVTKKINKKKPETGTQQSGNVSVLEEMLVGMQQFKGKSLIYVSGRSIQSKEFQALTKNSKDWRAALPSDRVKQHLLPDADQAFSRQQDRDTTFLAAQSWFSRAN